MLKEEFEELIKREVNENQYKNIETAYEALPEYMDKMYLASAISNEPVKVCALCICIMHKTIII